MSGPRATGAVWVFAASLSAMTLAVAPASAAGPGAGDVRTIAAEAYRTGRYDTGIRALRAGLSRLPARGEAADRSPARAEALYLLGRLELRKGELTVELARSARRYAANHLARLASGPTPLSQAYYFLGVARLEAGDREGGSAAFRQVLRGIPAGARGENAVVRQLADLRLGALSGRVPTVGQGADPRIAAETGALVATVGRDPARGLAIAEAALAAAGRKTVPPPASVIRATAAARLAAGRLDGALALLEGARVHLPVAAEKAGALLRVAYYDVPALGLLADATLRAAARDLEAAVAAASAEAAGLREAAGFAAARARLLAGDPRAALAALAPLGKPATLGPAGIARVKALAGRAQAALRAKPEATRLWQEVLAEAGDDPDALGELAEAVAEDRARGTADAQLAQAVLARAGSVAERLPRRAPQPLAAGLGLLTLAATGDAPAAVIQYERGRDKAAKNRIDANDPVFLARLAQAQVDARQFSEALEIYFEMAKTYPEVRQVQEALQGIYAAEQVAGGEVRIN